MERDNRLRRFRGMSEKQDDYDSPWKDILEAYFEDFFRFFFPEVARDVDWESGYEFLDTELRHFDRFNVLS